jgi:hypothetical protein
MALDTFHQQAATVALKKLFDALHFNICDLDNIIKLIGCIPDKKDYEALRCLHCVNWADMSPDLRGEVLKRVIKIVESVGFDTSVLDGRLLKSVTPFSFKALKH